MAEIKWDIVGEKLFEAGIDRGVFYHGSIAGGVPWNGLVSVTEKLNGGEITPHYIDGYLYHNEVGATDYRGTIEAFTYPDAFESVIGSSYDGGLSFENQPINSHFALSYRTLIGNDTEGIEHGYKIHIIYNCLAIPTDIASPTIGATVDPLNLSWDIVSRPPLGSNFYGHRPTAHVVWDSTRTQPHKTAEVERILYGDSSTNPRVPTTTELNDINHWGDALKINPNYSSGISPLTYTGGADLYGDVSRGIYKKHADSRLVATATPGINKLGV